MRTTGYCKLGGSPPEVNMAKINFVCKVCETDNEIEIFALSSDGFHLVCPACEHDFWFQARQNTLDACPVCFGDQYLIWNDGLLHPCPACNGTGKRQ